jgi:phenylalanyl-tRNA synthetase beta chain
MDLVEEYARLFGYEHIQESIPALRSEPAQHDPTYMLNQRVSQLIRAEGYSQAFNYAFTSEVHESEWLGGKATPAVKIRNPLSEELNVMRRSLSYGLWRNTLDNIRGGNVAGNLFEIGQVFSKGESFVEQSRLALISWGESAGIFANTAPPVYQIRAAIEKLLQSLQISSYSFVNAGEAPSFLHAGQWAQVLVEGKNAGYIGTVHPRLLDAEKVRYPVALAELDLQLILNGQPRPVKFKPLSKFQPVERDFAFVMASHSQVGDLLREARKACGSSLRELSVFDIYEGEKLPQGQKSVALRAVFQGGQEALNEAQVLELGEKLIGAAKKSVNAALR